MQDSSLITTFAMGLSAALVFGLLARRVGGSPIVGYLIAGILISPHTPGLEGDLNMASQLADIGVILLMFGVGLQFHIKDLLAVRRLAIPGAIGHSLVIALACVPLARLAGWSPSSGLMLGLALSVSSTVVLLRALMENHALDKPEGHMAVGWLVVEDIFSVLLLVLLPPLAAGQSGEGTMFKSMGLALFKLALLAAIMMSAGARFIPWLLLRVARLRSRELFSLTVLVMAISVATLSYFAFGASMALGAFLGGMVVGQSKVSHQAASDAMPMRDAFAVLFFVAVGMLFDYRVLLESPGLVLGLMAIILLVKPLVALAIIIPSGHSLRTGLIVAGGLAQIGEFSFILGELGKSLGFMPKQGYDILIASSILSISLNPFLFRTCLSWEASLQKWPWLATYLTRKHRTKGATVNTHPLLQNRNPARARAIVVGHGPAGRTVSQLLIRNDINTLVVETNLDTVLELQAAGIPALFGDATRPDILEAARLDTATYLVITIPDPDICLAIVLAARNANPGVTIFVRASYLNQQQALKGVGVSVICYDEEEVAAALARSLVQDITARNHADNGAPVATA